MSKKSKGLSKLHQMAVIADSYGAFGGKSNGKAQQTFVTSVDHQSKNVHNTITIINRKTNVRFEVITIRTNGELGIIEMKAHPHVAGNDGLDYLNLNRQLAEAMRY